MIAGVGIDVVAVQRMADALERTPTLAARLFTDAERELPIASLAARFAAKEAVAKALGSGRGLQWQEICVLREADKRPTLLLTGQSARTATRRGIGSWHLSLSHDAGVATAIVIAETVDALRPRER